MRTIGGSVYTLTHDAENRLVSISGAATASFSYDGRACPERSRRGNRVKSVLNGETVIYVGNLYEKKVVGSTTTHTKYYYFGGRRIAMRVAGTLYWLLGDHLGSTTVTVDGATGVRTAELWYIPWGESRGTPFGTTPTPRRFTGQVLDSVAGGLYFYNARYYDPVLGRFAQADTIVPEPGNPQALNRYSYVLNNPLRFIDDSGEIAIDIVGGGGGGGSAGMAVVMLISGIAQTTGQQISALTVRLAPAANAAVQTWSLAGNQVIAAGDQLSQAAQNAGQAGNTAGPGGLDPNDPFGNVGESIRNGVQTLRRQIGNPANIGYGRYGAQAHLSRAQYYMRQGTLQSVNPTGEGSIDLLLSNSTGVEVKYWQAQTVMQDIGGLARQFDSFNRMGLNKIIVEFVQTKDNPVTQATLSELQQQLVARYGLDLSKFVFEIVANPGIP